MTRETTAASRINEHNAPLSNQNRRKKNLTITSNYHITYAIAVQNDIIELAFPLTILKLKLKLSLL